MVALSLYAQSSMDEIPSILIVFQTSSDFDADPGTGSGNHPVSGGCCHKVVIAVLHPCLWRLVALSSHRLS